jgi:hypothetical protein
MKKTKRNGLKRASLKERPDFFRVPGRKINEQNDIRLMKRFETMEYSKNESSIRADVLLRSKCDEDKGLGYQLLSCKKGMRCLSPACSRCCRQFRRWWFAEVIHLYRTIPKGRVATIIYYSSFKTSEQLETFNPVTPHSRLYQQLRRAGFKFPVIGSLELDYHQELKLWNLHYHLLIFDGPEEGKKLRKVLNGPANKLPEEYRDRVLKKKVFRPLKIDPIKDPVEQLSYLFKGQSKHIRGSGKRKGRRMNITQERLVLRFKDRVGFKGLMFLYKARQLGNQLVATVSTTKSDE